MVTVNRDQALSIHKAPKPRKLFKGVKIDHQTIKSKTFDSLNSVQGFDVIGWNFVNFA